MASACYKPNRSSKKKVRNSKGTKTTVTHKAKQKRVKQTKRGKAQDKRIKALPSGRRKSSSGNTYSERRSNRSD